MPHPPEEKESLWLLVSSPLIWAAHFLLSYVTAAVWCAKMAGPDATLGFAAVLLVIYTVVALSGIAITLRAGYRRHSYGTATVPHDFDTPEDRHRFLGFATLLLSGLSGVAVVYVALAILLVHSCH